MSQQNTVPTKKSPASAPTSSANAPASTKQDNASSAASGNFVDELDPAIGPSPGQDGFGGLSLFGLCAVLVLIFGTVVVFTETFKKKPTSEQAEVPRLAHAVQEVQGWRRGNYIAAAIMVAMFALILFALMGYRRVRAERARQMDTVYWGLTISSFVALVLFILYRRRERKRSAMRKQMKMLSKNPPKQKILIVWGLFALIVIGLLWYRRRLHARRLERKKKKKLKQLQAGIAATTTTDTETKNAKEPANKHSVM